MVMDLEHGAFLNGFVVGALLTALFVGAGMCWGERLTQRIRLWWYTR